MLIVLTLWSCLCPILFGQSEVKKVQEVELGMDDTNMTAMTHIDDEAGFEKKGRQHVQQTFEHPNHNFRRMKQLHNNTMVVVFFVFWVSMVCLCLYLWCSSKQKGCPQRPQAWSSWRGTRKRDRSRKSGGGPQEKRDVSLGEKFRSLKNCEMKKEQFTIQRL